MVIFHSRRAYLSLLLMTLAFLPGCASTTISAQADPATPPPGLQPFLTQPSTAPSVIDDPAQLLPLRKAQLQYKIVEGDDTGSTRTQSFEPSDRPEAQWKHDTGDGRIEYLNKNTDGSIVLTAVIDTEHDVITHFTPPLPVIPAKLAPDHPITVTADAKVVKRNNPDEKVDSGQSSQTLTCESDQHINAPAGPYDCHRIRVTYHGSFGLATVDSTSIVYYAPSVGLVAEHYQESGSSFFVPWKKSWTIILNSLHENAQ